MPRRRGFALLALASMVCAGLAAAADPVPVGRAGEHVGEEITLEGRVVATHSSPLATVLAFNPNFAGFTAKILPSDRAKFPADLEQRFRNRLVHVSGQVADYRGKPEMTLRDPAQLVLVPAPGETPVPPNQTAAAPSPSPTPANDEATARALTLMEARLSVIEGRLAAIEQALAAQAAADRSGPVLAVGVPAGAVRDVLGDPVEIGRGPQNGSVWLYGEGRSVTFDRGGRVVAWTGF